MIANGGGSIVTLGGMMSLPGAKNAYTARCPSMASSFTRGLAREFGDRNIRANCIAPRQMNTMRASRRTAPLGDSMIPLARKGDAEEIATVVRFLCSPASSYVTGQSIQINDGQMMF